MVSIIFWVALIFTFTEAVIPGPDELQILPSDKMIHFLAFYVLATLAAVAYPARSLWIIGVGLSGFGGFIELIQAIPFVHRDCDIWDWVVDTTAIFAALFPFVTHWGREKLKSHSCR